jgi:hypothetical protein
LTSSWLARAGVAVVLMALGGLLAVFLWPEGKKEPDMSSHLAEMDGLQDGIRNAEAVARKFLAETDPATRLQWVRDEDAVRMRMEGYSGEARESPGEIEKMIGHVSEDGRTISAFAVAMPSGNMWLLEVVTAEDGPQVDWDAYARHGTATWEDLWSGKARRAVVRVSCEPATERPEPFGDQAKWTCFRMSSPDMPQAALAFAAVGSVREEMMKEVVLSTPNYRQRFVLEIVRHEGKDEPLFEIARCHAVGWIEADRAVEEEWAAE